MLDLSPIFFITEVAGQNHINTGAFYYGPWHSEATYLWISIICIMDMLQKFSNILYPPPPGKSTLPTFTWSCFNFLTLTCIILYTLFLYLNWKQRKNWIYFNSPSKNRIYLAMFLIWKLELLFRVMSLQGKKVDYRFEPNNWSLDF